jgi:hypothetical protein
MACEAIPRSACPLNGPTEIARAHRRLCCSTASCTRSMTPGVVRPCHAHALIPPVSPPSPCPVPPCPVPPCPMPHTPYPLPALPHTPYPIPHTLLPHTPCPPCPIPHTPYPPALWAASSPQRSQPCPLCPPISLCPVSSLGSQSTAGCSGLHLCCGVRPMLYIHTTRSYYGACVHSIGCTPAPAPAPALTPSRRAAQE